MSYEDKARPAGAAPAEAPEPWDSTRSVAPDPSWSIEKRLKWYQVASHVLLLNCSEKTRGAAALAADREVANLQAEAETGRRNAEYERYAYGTGLRA